MFLTVYKQYPQANCVVYVTCIKICDNKQDFGNIGKYII